MAQKTIAGVRVDVDELGYMTNLDQWTKEIALELAKEVEINELTDLHWKVVQYLQDEFKKGTALTIRKVSKSGVINTKELYDIFPGGPLKKASLIAGIPKPVGCV